MANGFDKHNAEQAKQHLGRQDLTHNGVQYVSIRAACNATGAKYYTVLRRVNEQGWKLTDAITAPTYARAPLNAEGKTIAKINEAIREYEPDRGLIAMIGRIVRDYLTENPYAK